MDSLGVDGHLDAFRLVRCQQSGGIYVHIGGQMAEGEPNVFVREVLDPYLLRGDLALTEQVEVEAALLGADPSDGVGEEDLLAACLGDHFAGDGQLVAATFGVGVYGDVLTEGAGAVGGIVGDDHVAYATDGDRCACPLRFGAAAGRLHVGDVQRRRAGVLDAKDVHCKAVFLLDLTEVEGPLVGREVGHRLLGCVRVGLHAALDDECGALG